MTNNTEERPTLIQGCDAPILRIVDGGDNTLLCAECDGSVLVEGYRPECLVGIWLQCNKCGHITSTPSLPPGETFHFKIVPLESTRRYWIRSTIEQHASVTLTCDQELAMESAETRPRPAETESTELSQDSLGALATKLDVLSGGCFTPYLESAERSIAHGERYFSENPLAWAIRYLLPKLDNGTLKEDEDTLVALALIAGYKEVLSRWLHHPHFPHLARELCSSFHHTLSKLIAANYLNECGNIIAHNLLAPDAGRSADLYVRFSAIKKFHLEVKAPEAIEWPNKLDQRSEMEIVVEKCLLNARGQIGTSNPGVLIIGSSCITRGFFENFDNAIHSTLQNKGTGHRGVAAVALVGLNEKPFQRTGTNSPDFSQCYRVVIAKNPYYFEDNPIQT